VIADHLLVAVLTQHCCLAGADSDGEQRGETVAHPKKCRALLYSYTVGDELIELSQLFLIESDRQTQLPHAAVVAVGLQFADRNDGCGRRWLRTRAVGGECHLD